MGEGSFPGRSQRVLLGYTAHQEKRIFLGRFKGVHKVDSDIRCVVCSMESTADRVTYYVGGRYQEDVTAWVTRRLLSPSSVLGRYILTTAPAPGATLR